MANPFDLDGPQVGPATGGDPDSLVILLHGLGADGNDLIGLAPQLARSMPGTLFVSPNAPFPCDMAPYGRQWFSLQDRSPSAILGGVRATAPILDDFLDQLLAHHRLSEDRLALLGFSQGTMMSLHVGLRRSRALAGILGYSGALIGAELLAAEIKSKPPVLLIHGDADEVVPFPAMAAAQSALEANGVPVTTERRPGLGHGIDPQGLSQGLRFLALSLGS